MLLRIETEKKQSREFPTQAVASLARLVVETNTTSSVLGFEGLLTIPELFFSARTLSAISGSIQK
jgi:hypothetical protein